MSKEHEAILHALGAVPVSALDRKLWGDDSGRTLLLKGERVDVNGWIAPHWAKEGSISTGEQRGPAAPLTFAQCVSYLDVDSYTATRAPQQFAIMAITLDRMLVEGVAIEDAEPIIKVYEAGIGLEDRALRLLKGSVRSARAMQLYGQYADSRLLEILPVPQTDEKSYIEFLREVANRHPDRGWLALSLLYAADKAAYKEEFRNSLIVAARAAGKWDERLQIFDKLAGIGDQASLDFLAGCLLTDPVTEVREAILGTALTSKVCSREFVRSVVLLANGFGHEHQSVTRSRMADQWNYSLREYLSWTKDSELCDVESRTEAASALDVLNR